MSFAAWALRPLLNGNELVLAVTAIVLTPKSSSNKRFHPAVA